MSHGARTFKQTINGKNSKKRKAALSKHDLDKSYPLSEAMAIVKDVNTA